MSSLNIKNDLEKYGHVDLGLHPDIFDILDLDKYKFINTEERNRDNNEKDLSEELNVKLNTVATYLHTRYIEPNWENGRFYKYTIWDGVDKDNQGWHTDMFEEYDLFFLCYGDDTAKETGGGIHFKWKLDGEFKTINYQPKRGHVFLVSNARGFWHRADNTSITRRVVSFDFITNE